MNKSNKDSNYWKRASALEEGRNQVLRMVAQNEKLELIFDTLCQNALIYNPDMFSSVLRLNQSQRTLQPLASVGLPDFYNEAIDGVAIGAGVGSCGTAAYTKQRVIVEDINTHPYWNQFKYLALEAGLQACWSEPIIGANGKLYGTFAMYYNQPKSPSDEDLKFIELSANLAAVVFENHANRQQLLDANNRLSQTINERNRELEEVNRALTQSIKDQQRQHQLKLNSEKMLTTNSLISGFSHEINTPVGTALTAISSAEEKLNVLIQRMQTQTLSRAGFTAATSTLTELISISKNSLLKTNELLQRFKDVNTLDTLEKCCHFNLHRFFEDIKQQLSGILGNHVLSIDSDDVEVYCNKESLKLVLLNLIENSIIHGFEKLKNGSIHINAIIKDDELVINYQDNGKGLTPDANFKIFEPFFTSARNKKHLGLGLSITNNLIGHNLKGRICLQASPVGVRFEINIPLNGENA